MWAQKNPTNYVDDKNFDFENGRKAKSKKYGNKLEIEFDDCQEMKITSEAFATHFLGKIKTTIIAIRYIIDYGFCFLRSYYCYTLLLLCSKVINSCYVFDCIRMGVWFECDRQL